VLTAGDTLTVEPDNAPGCHVYVVAPVPFNTVELPEHIVVALAEAVTVGVVFTVTATVTGDEAAQPEAVPVSVYVIETVGLAVTIAPVLALKLVLGVQVYVAALLPVNVVEVPEHIVEGAADADNVGVAFTVTTTV